MSTKRFLSRPAEGGTPEKLYYHQDDATGEVPNPPKKILKVDMCPPVPEGEIEVFSPDITAAELEIYYELEWDSEAAEYVKMILLIDETHNLPPGSCPA